MLGHIEDRIDHIWVVQADVATLFGQAVAHAESTEFCIYPGINPDEMSSPRELLAATQIANLVRAEGRALTPQLTFDQFELPNLNANDYSYNYTQKNFKVLMGASGGAVVASKIASNDARITHLALIGGGGSTLRENLQRISQKTWYFTAPNRTFAEIAADPENTSKSAWGHSYKYWSTILDVNIGDLLLSLNIPIVMAMGERDESVPIEAAHTLK